MKVELQKKKEEWYELSASCGISSSRSRRRHCQLHALLYETNKRRRRRQRRIVITNITLLHRTAFCRRRRRYQFRSAPRYIARSLLALMSERLPEIIHQWVIFS
jgi:hypothetical protein